MSKYYLLTLPASKYVFAPVYLPSGVAYMRGQLELPEPSMGAEEGYLHWQFIVYTERKVRASFVRKLFGCAHVETTRSAQAESYVWKEDTYVDGSRFEIGQLPMRRNREKDWEAIWDHCKAGRICEIPADIRVRCYRTIRSIEKDYLSPCAFERQIYVFWGRSGTGKTRKAWEEAGLEGTYPKDPCTKFWDGYLSQCNVIIDEFRGQIGISHILRWLDRYPTIVEIKGGAVCLAARKIWITSNICPTSWYPDLDSETVQALLRRLTIVQEFV